MKKSVKLLLEIAKQTQGMGTFELPCGEDEGQFIWNTFHVALCENIGLKKEVTYIYAYEDVLNIALPKADFYLSTKEDGRIKIYEI